MCADRKGGDKAQDLAMARRPKYFTGPVPNCYALIAWLQLQDIYIYIYAFQLTKVQKKIYQVYIQKKKKKRRSQGQGKVYRRGKDIVKTSRQGTNLKQRITLYKSVLSNPVKVCGKNGRLLPC